MRRTRKRFAIRFARWLRKKGWGWLSGCRRDCTFAKLHDVEGEKKKCMFVSFLVSGEDVEQRVMACMP